MLNVQFWTPDSNRRGLETKKPVKLQYKVSEIKSAEYNYLIRKIEEFQRLLLASHSQLVLVAPKIDIKKIVYGTSMTKKLIKFFNEEYLDRKKDQLQLLYERRQLYALHNIKEILHSSYIRALRMHFFRRPDKSLMNTIID